MSAPKPLPPCPSCAERLAPPPAPEAPILPVCLDCSFASGGHVHVNREDGSQAVRYPTAEEWNAAIRQTPPSDAVREAAEALLDDYAGVEDMLLPDTLEKVLRLRAALRGGQEGEGR